MKFLWHWEWKMEDFEKEQEMGEKFLKAMEENPDQFPKMLTGTCFTGKCKGFRLIEAENEEQLMNLVTFWWSTEDWRLEPYLESGEALGKAFQKWM